MTGVKAVISFRKSGAALFGIFRLAASAWAEMPDLHRGINLSHWYAQSMTGGYDESHLGTYDTEKDAQNIATMGFDHVRWPLNPKVVFTDKPGKLNNPAVAKLQERMMWFTRRGMSIIIDLHPDNDYVVALAGSDDAPRQKFCDDWAALANVMAKFDPSRVAFEVLNEPSTIGDDPWRDLQWRAVQAIRKAAPKHAIVVNPGKGSNYDDLIKFRGYDLPDLIYTFHYYNPAHFTHQGATWTGPSLWNLHDVPWPVDPSQAQAVADRCGDKTEEGKKDIHWQILQGEYTPEWMDVALDQVALWRRKNGNVPIYVGEFGVYKARAPRPAILAWREAARKGFEARGFAWATWDYAGGFALVDEKTRAPDAEMLAALGLKLQTRH